MNDSQFYTFNCIKAVLMNFGGFFILSNGVGFCETNNTNNMDNVGSELVWI